MLEKLLSVLSVFYKKLIKEIGEKLLEEVNENLKKLEDKINEEINGLNKEELAKKIIDKAQELLLNSWPKVVKKYGEKLGFIQKIVLDLLSPLIIKEINDLDKYEAKIAEFISASTNENKVEDVIAYITHHANKIIIKIFKL
jgi:hypothetical protein